MRHPPYSAHVSHSCQQLPRALVAAQLQRRSWVVARGQRRHNSQRLLSGVLQRAADQRAQRNGDAVGFTELRHRVLIAGRYQVLHPRACPHLRVLVVERAAGANLLAAGVGRAWSGVVQLSWED